MTDILILVFLALSVILTTGSLIHYVVGELEYRKWSRDARD